jgi:hypothetical protein
MDLSALQRKTLLNVVCKIDKEGQNTGAGTQMLSA